MDIVPNNKRYKNKETPKKKPQKRNLKELMKKETPKNNNMNPEELEQHINDFDPSLVQSIMSTEEKGVLKRISKHAFATPHGVKANCYAFFLTLPDNQWQDRKNKTQPGDNCEAEWAKTPLKFSSRGQASNQLIKRVMCDNGQNGVVNFVKPLRSGYPEYITQIKLPKGYILGCCIVGGSDYHFCRREGIDEMLKNQAFQEIWKTKNVHTVRHQLEQLKELGHTYCWSHVAGWSGRLKLVDSDGIVITNPVDKTASGSAVRHLEKKRANHNYNGLHYDTFVAFFILKAHTATVKDSNKIRRNAKMSNSALRNMGMSKETIKNFLMPK